MGESTDDNNLRFLGKFMAVQLRFFDRSAYNMLPSQSPIFVNKAEIADVTEMPGEWQWQV